ncbi:hypothetical protein HGI15_05110 [Modestobacter lapidis]|nr:hypothetical protein [Modestobacter lapidis]
MTGPVLVIVPRGCPWDGPRGVRVHKTDLGPADTWMAEDGVRVTSAQRSAWELATLETTGTAVAFIDGMLHAGRLSEQAFVAEVARRRGQWRSKRAAGVVALVDGRKGAGAGCGCGGAPSLTGPGTALLSRAAAAARLLQWMSR